MEVIQFVIQGGLPAAACVACWVLWKEVKRLMERQEKILDRLLEADLIDAQAVHDIKNT